MPYIPHTDVEVTEMLQAIGAKSVDELFDEIPAALRIPEIKNIPTGIGEMQALRLMQHRADKDQAGLCFIGAGAYEHHIPAAVWDITTRGEFMTAYTPYQAEASQGTLQLLYEYQTMMANLTGMDVSNASLYDGASSLAEAILMAIRAQRKNKVTRVLLPTTVHPHYRKVVKSIVRNQKIEVVEIPFDAKLGRVTTEILQQHVPGDFAALVIPQPNFLGILEEVDELTDFAHAANALVIAVNNPTSLALLKQPGKWGKLGADIACGEGQPLGVPLASGGPYFGFMCCKQELVRQMPGRIIGRTVDIDGTPGFALTLQAREQHIRRSKATSNICTNQGLLVTAATIYMSLLGATGLRQVALASHHNAKSLMQKLTSLPGVKPVFTSPFFHEFVLRFEHPIANVLHDLGRQGIQGGFDLSYYYPELRNCLLVCATETKTEDDLNKYVKHLHNVLNNDESVAA